MKKKNIKKHLIIALVALGVIILDQITKFFVSSKMSLSESIPIINNVFHFTYIQNRGAGFGILQNQYFLLIAFPLIALGIIAYYYRKIPDNKIFHLTIGLLIGGIIGNLIDRIRFEYVVDFLDFRIWPAFNVADSAVTIAGLYLIFYLMKKNS